MTEKRFTYMEQFNGFCDVYDTGKILSCMRLEYVDKTVNLLNEQHETIQVLKASNGEMEDYLARLEEENEQLKKDATILIYANQDYRKENEQLKSTINTLTHDNTKMKKVLNTTKNENITLKKSETATEELLIQQWQQNTKIKHTIKEAIYNERTELGKSVLKQLLNNIEAIQ